MNDFEVWDEKQSGTKSVWKPDYESYCDVCGQSPVVTSVDEDGKENYRSDMCGPCTFGEAACLDPDVW